MENKEQNIETILAAIAKSYQTVENPAPILKTPDHYGLNYENLRFPSEDGLKLAGWLIRAEGSDKLIICNHPATLNRYGWPGHQEPWNQFQDIEVEFGNVYKALHNAGYNVLTYDLRNHGESDPAPDHAWGQGFFDEYKDVIAAFDYVNAHEELRNMAVGLFNPCAGGGAAIHAMTQRPEYFEKVKAFVCPQPASINVMSRVALEGQGLGEHYEQFAQEVEKVRGLKLEDMTPHVHAKNIRVPTFIIQNKEDVWTIPDDVQRTFDLIPGDDKKLFWIERGDTRRFIGYNYFGEHPEAMIEWFDRYMK